MRCLRQDPRGSPGRKSFGRGDGPRSSRPGEAALCRAARAVLDRVDGRSGPHDFATRTGMRGRRIGERTGVGIEEVEEAVIVEERLHPDP